MWIWRDSRRETPSEPPIYRRVDPSVFAEQEDHLLFQRFCDHLVTLLGDRAYESDPKYLRNFPHEACIIFYLWRASCELGGGGFGVYLVQGQSQELRSVHAALLEVGAKQLVRLFEVAVPLAAPSSDFIYEDHDGWFAQFWPQPGYVELADVDAEASAYYSDHLSHLAATYIKANSHAL